jgi:phage terminase large subunit-like protein
LEITSGVHAGRPFKVRDWQRDIIEAIYAEQDNRRVVRNALISVPRKQGKTALAAALALCHLVGPEAERRGQVVSAAADRAQAAIIYNEIKAFAEADGDLYDRMIVRDYKKEIEDAVTGSTYRALSSDGKKAHGLSPSFIIADELAQWRGRELWDALVTSTGARAEPLMITIGTQSADPHSIMSEQVRYGESVISGSHDDRTFHATLYSAPLDADPWDEQTWFDCNPALDDFRSLDEFRAAAIQAKKMPSKEAAFRLLYLNQPVATEQRFINAQDWLAIQRPMDLADMKGRPCWGGLDLSSTTDLTSLVLVFPQDDGSLQAFTWTWVPGDNLAERENRDRVPYPLWARDGLITATPGRAIDRAFIVHTLGELASTFDIRSIAYDRWRMEDLNKMLADEGIDLNLVAWGQGFRDMGPAVERLESAILNKTLYHDGNQVLTWCASNAVAVSDPTGARKLDKAKSYDRIDALIALLMAVGLYYREPEPFKSVYSERGIVIL